MQHLRMSLLTSAVTGRSYTIIAGQCDRESKGKHPTLYAAKAVLASSGQQLESFMFQKAG